MRGLLALPVAFGLLFAGCVNAPDPVDAASTAPDGTLTPSGLGETITVSETGATHDAAYVCSPAAPCLGTYAPARGGPSFFETEITGILDGAELVLTWDAATPATEELVLGIAYLKSEDEMDWITVQGPSPLTLSKTGLGIRAEDFEAVYVNSFTCTPTPVAPCASTAQAFTLEGTLTTIPDDVAPEADADADAST